MKMSGTRWTLTLPAALGLAALLAAAPADAANTAMKDLMKKMGAQTASGDAKALAPIFAQVKGMAPSDPDYSGWAAIADAGKAAAEKGNLDGAKATCKDCHSKYRDKYKTKYGSKSP